MTRVFEASRPNFADYTICIVDLPAKADLIVYRDDAAEAASHGEMVWSFVDRREAAQCTVYFQPRGMIGGDLNVAFTDQREMAGWQRHHRLRGSLASPRKQRHKPPARPGQRQVYWGG